MTLTPTSSVAVLGLANMRYEQEPPGVPSNAGFPPQPQYSTQSITSHSAINNSNSPVTPAIGLAIPTVYTTTLDRQGLASSSGSSRGRGLPTHRDAAAEQSGQQSLNGLANHPIGRYLSLLELQQHGRLQGNGEVGARSPLGLPLGAVPSALPAYLNSKVPISTIATTPAVFVSASFADQTRLLLVAIGDFYQ
ncbi:hypothetical protein BX661DRAFT_170017 [Kickxella alabastrina]|uniref:uncharacterized protein n=1 Tax=Kickxella alabastrina TaxID=61397 RepID=UPI00221E9B68|nr:uncharacterized protein BX661DRAFT_170017 [Kickxella alabastrina]KAI7830811.1 hypothetical protein BX661DRAFT_170017 [Kickxella alabastrina]